VHEVLKKERDAARARQHMIDLLDHVVRRAQAEGTLRPDVGTGDVAVMFALLAHPLSIEWTAAAQMASERCMALLLESLRAGGSHDALPGSPIWAEHIVKG
jgi:hypothetical protein